MMPIGVKYYEIGGGENKLISGTSIGWLAQRSRVLFKGSVADLLCSNDNH